MQINKSALYQEYKRQVFEKIGGDPDRMFEFMVANNGIFKFISLEDEAALQNNYYQYVDRSFNWTFGGLAAVFFTDKVFLRYFYPNFRLNGARPLVFLFKWMLLPCISYSIGRSFFMTDLERQRDEIADKYNFGFEDFQRAMLVWDRAERVGRLEQLMEKHDDFDWSTVPQLPQSKTRAWDA